MSKKITRREFIQIAGLVAGGSALAACAPQVVTVTVKQTEVVKETVKQTEVVQKEVVKEVTPTAPALIKTTQGRELPPDAAPLEKQIFFEGGSSEPKHLDVARDLFSSTNVLNWGAEPLLRLDENQEIVPALAESWKAGPGVEYWEFVIRQDAKWSDGEPITADDWVFTFQHYGDPALGNPFAYFYADIKGFSAYNAGTGSAADVGVTKVDDRTFRIAGTLPAPHIPAMMTYQAVVPAPKHKAEKDPQHWADTMEGFVSSGPFTLKQWEHNKFLIWEQNQYYNGPHKPGIMFVKQLIGTETTNWFAAFLNHEHDMIGGMDAASLAQVRADPKLNALLHWWIDPRTDYFVFDTMHPPLDNQKLRLALAKSIDRVTMCNDVFKGVYTPGYSMLMEGFPAYNPDLKPIQDYDVEAAKKLLADAGYPEGKDSAGKQLELTITFRFTDPFVEFAQQQWQDNLGIKVNVVQVENSVFRQMRSEKKMQVFHNFYEYDYMDPANLITTLWKSDGKTGAPQVPWVNAQFDDLCTKAGTEVDPAKRIALYQEAEKILVTEAPGAFLDYMNIFQIWWPYLVGIKPNKKGEVAYRYLDISRFQMYINNTVDQYRTQTL